MSIIMLWQNVPDKKWFQDDVTGEYWFHGSWVASELGFSKTTQAVLQHTEDDERQKIDIGTINLAWFVSEAGVWGMILGSKTSQARAFRQELKTVILPTIRAQGAYIDRSRFSQQEYDRLMAVIQERDERIAQLEENVKGLQQNLTKTSQSLYIKEQQLIDREIAIDGGVSLFRQWLCDNWRISDSVFNSYRAWLEEKTSTKIKKDFTEITSVNANRYGYIPRSIYQQTPQKWFEEYQAEVEAERISKGMPKPRVTSRKTPRR